jgi:hypothetical protein
MSAELWDARAEVAIAVMIHRFLAERPPPDESALADDLQEWAAGLSCDGHARLRELGRSPLECLEGRGQPAAMSAKARTAPRAWRRQGATRRRRARRLRPRSSRASG